MRPKQEIRTQLRQCCNRQCRYVYLREERQPKGGCPECGDRNSWGLFKTGSIDQKNELYYPSEIEPSDNTPTARAILMLKAKDRARHTFLVSILSDSFLFEGQPHFGTELIPQGLTPEGAHFQAYTTDKLTGHETELTGTVEELIAIVNPS